MIILVWIVVVNLRQAAKKEKAKETSQESDDSNDAKPVPSFVPFLVLQFTPPSAFLLPLPVLTSLLGCQGQVWPQESEDH